MNRVRALTDEERRVVAERRRSLDETHHERSLQAGADALARQAHLYVRSRAEVATAHVPDALGEDEADPEWVEISRLVQIAIDEGLVAVVGSGTLHPNHLRELIAPWPAELPGA